LFASRCLSSGVTTITDVDPIELIAVKNRSHKIIKLLSGSPEVSLLIRPAVILDAGWAEILNGCNR
jgi:hypothetical protein